MSAEDWAGFREGKREKRERQLAESDTTGFRQCSEYHFQRELCGDLLDWWPSSRRWRWRGRTYYGHSNALHGFVRNRELLDVPD